MEARRTVLVTGAGGFIGTALVRRLREKEWDVVAWTRRGGDGAEAVDLMDPDAVRRAFRRIPSPEAVVHLAALNQQLDRFPDAEIHRVNVGLLAHLVAVVEERPVRFVFSSSVAVYGPCLSDAPRGLETPPDPVTAYGRAKLAGEELLRRSRLPEVDVVRLPPVYSEKERSDVAKRVFLPGTRVRLRLEPSPSYTLAHVDAVAEWFVSLLDKPAESARIHLPGVGEITQHLLCEWFHGPGWSAPAGVLQLAAKWLARGPGSARRLADKIGKVGFSNLFDPRSGPLRTDASLSAPRSRADRPVGAT